MELEHSLVSSQKLFRFSSIFQSSSSGKIISTLILVLLERPNVAGLMVLIVGIARIFYALGYRRNVKDRFPYFLVAQFAGLVGVRYGALAAASIVNIGPFVVGVPTTSN